MGPSPVALIDSALQHEQDCSNVQEKLNEYNEQPGSDSE